MNRAVFKAAVILSLRSAWVWAIGVIGLLLVWAYVRFGGGVLMMAMVAHRPGFTFWGIFFLGQMLAVVTEAHRDQSERTGEVFGALPYRSGELVTARFAAWYLVWLTVATFLYVIETLFAVVVPGAPPDWFVLWDWFVLIALTLVLTTGLGYWIGARVRRGFAAYLWVMVIFAAVSPFGVQIIAMFTYDLFGFGPGTEFDILLSNYFALTGVHPFPDAYPLIFNRIFVTALGLAAVAGLARRYNRLRRDAPPRLWQVVHRTAATLAVAAVVLTSLYWQPLTDEAWAQAAASRWVPGADTAAVPAPAVSEYEIALALSPGFLEGQAALTVQAGAEPAVFTLNRSLKVAGVAGPDGAPVPFSRSGDLLLVSTGGRAGPYTVSYGGPANHWRKDGWKGLRLEAHVLSGSVVLPTAYAWYPLPGMQALASPSDLGWGPVSSGIRHKPAPVRLSVTAPAGLTVVSNADGGAPVTGAWLIATPYTALAEAGGTRLHLSSLNARQGRLLLDRYGAQAAFYEELVPLHRPLTVVEINDALSFSFDGSLIDQFPGALVMTAMQVGRLDNLVVTNQLVQGWWSGGLTEEDLQVRDVLAAFMMDLYQTTHPEDNWVGRPFRLGRRPFGPDTEPGRAALQGLNALAAKGGPEAVGRLLRQLHDQTEPLTWQALEAALQKEAL